MKKWFALGLGGIIGLSHIGLIGMVSRKNNLPIINPPVTIFIISSRGE